MSSVSIHPKTQQHTDYYRKKLPHALLLTGPVGVGLNGIAEYILSESQGDIVRILPEKNEKVDIENGTITVDIIRRLYDITKTAGISRYIVIDFAERMAKPAQNAFLKLLEEPNASTKFILLSHQPEMLLPTIMSRVQTLHVAPITSTQSQEVLSEMNITDAARQAQMLFIAKGLPAELKRLADDTYFAARSAIVRDAKAFITGSSYERARLGQVYKDDRKKAIALLDDVIKLLSLPVMQKGDTAPIRRIEAALEAREKIQRNGNVRLQLAVAL